MVKVDNNPVHSAGKACVLTLKASAVKNISAGKRFGLSPKTEAPKRLDALIEKSAELSKCATHLPYRKGLIEEWEDHVIRERVPGYKAALA